MPDLSTSYLGLKLKSPIVASAGPLCKDIGHILHMEDAGVGAVVLHSLFEEQIHESQELDRHLNDGSESYAESTSYFPISPITTSVRTAMSSTFAKPNRLSTFRSSGV